MFTDAVMKFLFTLNRVVISSLSATGDRIKRTINKITDLSRFEH